ncbi:MAG: substrate-binding domain-containing protein [bacterium]|nr:substrate-binding domain-containing protein [bacterium]
MKIQRHFRVLVSLPLETAAGRKKLNGIHRFLNEGHDWNLELVRSDASLVEQWSSLQADSDIDGLIASTQNGSLVRRLHQDFAVPSVYIANPQPGILEQRQMGVFIMDDVKAIVRAAIGHFTTHGALRTLAFVPTRTPSPWSNARCEAFIHECIRRRRTVETYAGADGSRDHLTEWIRNLPKPAGILAAYDDRARDVLEACRTLGIKVPDEVSVLGIGNDELVCEMVAPQLSSIAVDFEAHGYSAARELQAMMLRRRRPVRTVIPCGIREVVVRSSTWNDNPSNALANRALQYIEQHALAGITPPDVVQHLNVSRSLLDLRFRAAFNMSVLDAILTRRLGEVRRLLETTTFPISLIAARCGYRDANYLKNQFRRRFGKSMREWRKTAQSPNPSPSPVD